LPIQLTFVTDTTYHLPNSIGVFRILWRGGGQVEMPKASMARRQRRRGGKAWSPPHSGWVWERLCPLRRNCHILFL